jgi:hypothetical protein
MLFATAHRLVTAGKQMDEVTRNAFIESFTTHVRALSSFLYDPRKWDDDVLSDQYVKDIAAWHRARRKKPKTLRRSGQRVGKEIGHLTLRRYRGTAPQKQRSIVPIVAQLTRSLKRFAEHADPKRLHGDVKGLIESLQVEQRRERPRPKPEPPQRLWTADVIDPDAATWKATTDVSTIVGSRHFGP